MSISEEIKKGIDQAFKKAGELIDNVRAEIKKDGQLAEQFLKDRVDDVKEAVDKVGEVAERVVDDVASVGGEIAGDLGGALEFGAEKVLEAEEGALETVADAVEFVGDKVEAGAQGLKQTAEEAAQELHDAGERLSTKLQGTLAYEVTADAIREVKEFAMNVSAYARMLAQETGDGVAAGLAGPKVREAKAEKAIADLNALSEMLTGQVAVIAAYFDRNDLHEHAICVDQETADMLNQIQDALIEDGALSASRKVIFQGPEAQAQ